MAKATQVFAKKFPQSAFVIPLADALDQLLKAKHIEVGASWNFQVSGADLIITRISPNLDDPVDNT